MTPVMRVCLVQFNESNGEVEESLTRHERFIRQAIELRADLLVFPELSLTGYEQELAENLAFQKNDTRLQQIQELSSELNMIVCLGLPISSNSGIQICMMICRPEQPPVFYAKSLLHPDEYPYFVAGREDFYLDFENEIISPAICFESFQESHLHKVSNRNTTMYLSSVAKHKKGVEQAFPFFAEYSKSAQCVSLMCNSVGSNSEFACAGTSSIWNKNGELVAQLDQTNEGLLLFDTQTEETLTISI